MGHVRQVAGLVAAVVVGLMGCTSDTASRSVISSAAMPAVTAATQSAASSSPDPMCSQMAPVKIPSQQHTGTSTTTIPDEPTSSLGCRYHGLNQPQPYRSLATSAHLDTAVIATELNSIPIPPANSPLPNCPADFGERYIIRFGYENGSTLLVSVDGGGCAYADNGDLRVPFASAALASLQAVLGQDSQ